jgi:hypothetical protein
MSRRGFLAGCATCAGAMVIPMAGSAALAAGPKKKRVRVIYSLHADVQPGPDWPNVGFDFRPVMERMTAALSEGCPEIEFIPTTAAGEDQAKEILAKDAESNVDGYVVLQMNCWNRVVQTMVTSGKPVLYADFLYAGSGGFLVYTAGFLRQEAKNFGFIGSSKFADVVEAAKCFLAVETPDQFGAAVAKVRIAKTRPAGSQDCKPDEVAFLSPSEWKEKMKQSKILTVGGEGWRGPKSVIEQLGVQVPGKRPTRTRLAMWPTCGRSGRRRSPMSPVKLSRLRRPCISARRPCSKTTAPMRSRSTASADSTAGTSTPTPAWDSTNCATRGSWGPARTISSRRPPWSH